MNKRLGHISCAFQPADVLALASPSGSVLYAGKFGRAPAAVKRFQLAACREWDTYLTSLSALALSPAEGARYVARNFGDAADDDCVVIASELCEEPLFDRLAVGPQVDMVQRLQWARELVMALDACHAHGLVHGSVKRDNILIDRGHVRLSDPGLWPHLVATAPNDKLQLQLARAWRRTFPPYATAPEVEGAAAAGVPGIAFSPAADVYALGAALLSLLGPQARLQDTVTNGYDAIGPVLLAHALAEPRRDPVSDAALTTFRKRYPSIACAIRSLLHRHPSQR